MYFRWLCTWPAISIHVETLIWLNNVKNLLGVDAEEEITRECGKAFDLDEEMMNYVTKRLLYGCQAKD